uniref:Uncharacterized protein n=1 Tax=Wuchereria bancrofti TaxID=6293 RepID=A0A1I8EI56_WUCBA
NTIIGNSLHNIQICSHPGILGDTSGVCGEIKISKVVEAEVSEVFSFSFFRRAYQRTNSIPDDLVAAQKQLASILGCIATSHNETSRNKIRTTE